MKHLEVMELLEDLGWRVMYDCGRESTLIVVQSDNCFKEWIEVCYFDVNVYHLSDDSPALVLYDFSKEASRDSIIYIEYKKRTNTTRGKALSRTHTNTYFRAI